MTTGPEPNTSTPQASEITAATGPDPILDASKVFGASWRILVFVVLTTYIRRCLFLIPFVHLLRLDMRMKSELTPIGVVATVGAGVLALVIVLAIMLLIDRRPFSDYGWPLKEAFGKKFWLGLPVGFLALTLLIGFLAVFHAFSAGGVAVTARDAVKDGLLYAIAFLLVGIREEVYFRGYLQTVSASVIGFWPAAILLGVVFGAVHLGNSGEEIFGAAMAGTFGLVAAFSLRRTGSLWFAIAMHAAWDWGESFFYSVPDSGLVASGHLLNASLHGPSWLTGGSVGPEGSLLVLPVLLLWAAAIHLMFPARRNRS